MENDTLELIDLESMLDDTPKCESLTHDYGRILCSGDVAFRLSDCERPRNVCTNMGVHANALIATHSDRCGRCFGNLSECWTVHPI